MNLVIFSLLVIGVAAWNGIILYQDLLKTKKNEIRLHQLGAKIIYFDEVLTMSARLAAAKNDLAWEKRYQIYEKKLISTLNEVKQILPVTLAKRFIAKTEEANNRLVTYEKQSFTFIKEGKPEVALKLLLGKEYKDQKEIYDQGIRNFIDQISTYGAKVSQEIINRLIWFSALCFGVFTTAWFIALFSIKKHYLKRMTVESDLIQSEERLNLALDATSEGVWDWNIETNEVFFSPQWCKSLGYAPDEILPHLDSWKKLVHLDDMPELIKKLDAHFKGQTPFFEMENRLKTKSGDWRWNLDRGKVVKRDESGKPLRMVGTGADITVRKKAEIALKENENLLRNIINNTTALIYLKDTQGRYILINHQFEKLFNITNENTRGKTDLDIFPQEIALQFINNDKKVLDSGTVMELEEVALHDNKLHTYISVKFPVHDQNGEPIGLGGISTDITERKEAEEKLKSFSRELQRSNKDLEAFAYLASHDLQEPLRKIISFSDLLGAKKVNLDDQARNYLTRMQNAAAKMRILIYDLLDFSRLTTPTKPFEPTDLASLIKEVVDDFDDQIRKLKGKIIIATFPTLNVDRAQMQRVIQNLISNSIKYMKKTIPPVIELGSSFNDKTGNWEIRVKDNGIGFDEKYLDRIFKPFERLHNQQEYQGTGIGLAICEKIMHLHGGEISAKSQPGKGATFIVSLPKTPFQRPL
ncbi:MAG: PAS domain-containing protein [Nitrospinae bacterium]|nr:PAS domain-containing protein [Nitrospinota bacterium]